MLQLIIFSLFLINVYGIDNGLGITPPLGWRSWNQFQCSVDQNLLEQIFDQLIKKFNGVSLADMGYIRPGLDDCWQLCNSGPNGKGFHDADGNPIVDTSKFPDMKAMNDKAHKNGLLPEWYLNNCQCADSCSDQKCFQGDVNAVIKYGFDGVKLDGCGGEENVTLFASLFNATGKPVLIENCHNGPNEPNATWCPFNYFRSSDDIRPTYASVVNNLQSVRPWVKYVGPGCWPYPDMLEVGVTNSQRDNMTTLTYTEARSHFGAWCIVSSPLILGFDLRDENTLNLVWDIITNKEAIAVNQAWAGLPGDLVAESTTKVDFINCDWEGDNCSFANWQIWSKPVNNAGSVAVLLMNHDTMDQDLTVTFSSVPQLNCTTCKVRDLWSHLDLGSFTTNFTVQGVPSHDSVFLLITSN